jgi:hypothetical protein
MAVSGVVCCLLAQWLVGHGGPREADEFAGDGELGTVARLPRSPGKDAMAVVEADLGLPGARRDERCELVTRGARSSLGFALAGRMTVMPGGLDQPPTRVHGPALVMCPRCWDSPLEYSDGVSPR